MFNNPIKGENSCFLPKINSNPHEILVHNELKSKNKLHNKAKENRLIHNKIAKTPRYKPSKILSGVGEQLFMLFLADDLA